MQSNGSSGHSSSNLTTSSTTRSSRLSVAAPFLNAGVGGGAALTNGKFFFNGTFIFLFFIQLFSESLFSLKWQISCIFISLVDILCCTTVFYIKFWFHVLLLFIGRVDLICYLPLRSSQVFKKKLNNERRCNVRYLGKGGVSLSFTQQLQQQAGRAWRRGAVQTPLSPVSEPQSPLYSSPPPPTPPLPEVPARSKSTLQRYFPDALKIFSWDTQLILERTEDRPRKYWMILWIAR